MCLKKRCIRTFVLRDSLYRRYASFFPFLFLEEQLVIKGNLLPNEFRSGLLGNQIGSAIAVKQANEGVLWALTHTLPPPCATAKIQCNLSNSQRRAGGNAGATVLVLDIEQGSQQEKRKQREKAGGKTLASRLANQRVRLCRDEPSKTKDRRTSRRSGYLKHPQLDEAHFRRIIHYSTVFAPQNSFAPQNRRKWSWVGDKMTAMIG